MAWATTADVTTITGQTIDAAALALAQATIEDHVNRTPDADAAMTARDLHWLKKAVCWQAAWLPNQHDYLSRINTQAVTQDGFSASFESRVDQMVAPLAQRALRNLSWYSPRSVDLSGGRLAGIGATTDATWLNEAADPDDDAWGAL